MNTTTWAILGVIAYLIWKSKQPTPGLAATTVGQAFTLTRGTFSAILPDASIAVPVWPGGYDS